MSSGSRTHDVESGAPSPAVHLDDFSLLDPDFLANPYPYFAQMRRHRPVFLTALSGVPIYVVTTDELCRQVLEDPQTYSSHFSLQGKPSPDAAARGEALRDELGGYPRVNTLVTEDPPRHTRFRKLVASAFTPRAMAKWHEAFMGMANRIVDELDGTSDVEFRSAFTDPLGMRAIALVLGVEDSRLDDFMRWARHTLVGFGTEVDDEEYVEAQRSVVELQHYFAGVIADRRASPRDDLLTRLVNARLSAEDAASPDGDPLTDPELLEMCQTLLSAAGHTTTRALTEMFHQLARHPQWWQRAVDDPESRTAIIEESVRFAAPAVSLWRKVTVDTRLGGVDIPARSKILVSFASSTRDEAVVNRGDVFDPERSELRKHLAWGRGIHACLGQSLARAELRIALDVLTSRLTSIEIQPGQSATYERNFMARGIATLPLRLAYS